MPLKCPMNHEPYRLLKFIGTDRYGDKIYWCHECGTIVTHDEDNEEIIMNTPLVYLDRPKEKV